MLTHDLMSKHRSDRTGHSTADFSVAKCVYVYLCMPVISVFMHLLLTDSLKFNVISRTI